MSEEKQVRRKPARQMGFEDLPGVTGFGPKSEQLELDMGNAGGKAKTEGDRIQQFISDVRQGGMVDSLTGLYNRGYFDDRLHKAVAEAERNRGPVSLILFDVDSLKDINDTVGHPAGDTALKGIADAMKGVLRKGDDAFRLGGDEFAILLRDDGADVAMAVANRVRNSLDEQGIPSSKGKKLTVSIGIAEYPANAVSADELYDRADRVLRQSKDRHRENVLVKPDSLSEITLSTEKPSAT